MSLGSQKRLVRVSTLVTLLVLVLGAATRRDAIAEHVHILRLLFGGPATRADAAQTLGERKSLREVPTLVKALSDKQRDVRAQVFAALGEIGPAIGDDAIRMVAGSPFLLEPPLPAPIPKKRSDPPFA